MAHRLRRLSSSPGRIAALLCWLALPLATGAAGASPSPGGPADLGAWVSEDSARVLALAPAVRGDSVALVFADVIAAARRAGDHRTLARALLLVGSVWSSGERPLLALPPLDEAITLTTASRDSALLCRALRSRAYAHGQLGRFADQRHDAQRLLAIAIARHDDRFEGIARAFLGWLALRRGDLVEARRELLAAVAIQRRLGNDREETLALLPLGSALTATGELEAARETYRRALSLARRSGDGWMESQLLCDIATLERQVGDEARAVDAYRAAYRSQRARDAMLDAVTTLGNMSVTELMLGRVREAAADLDTALALASTRGLASQTPWLLAQRLGTERELGRGAALRATARRILQMGDAAPVPPRIEAAVALARSLAAGDSLAEARSVLAWAATTLVPHATLEERGWFSLTELDLGGDPPARARDRALRIAGDGERLGFVALALAAWARVLPLDLVLEDDERARLHAERVMAVWERHRRRSTDPEWREVHGEELTTISAALITLALRDPRLTPRERVAAAFDRMERARARTLRERMQHAAAPVDTTSPPSLDRIRTRVLRADEALLEYAFGPDSCWLFVATSDSAAVVRLPAAGELGAAISLYHDLVAYAPGPHDGDSERALGAAARRLRRMLLGDATTLLATRPRWLVSPDGPVHLIPFETIHDAGGSVEADHVIVSRIPSAAVLAVLRASAPGNAPARMLAIAGHRKGDHGERIGGEVDDLARRFRDVVTVRPAANDAGAVPLRSLRSYQLLHVASHTTSDDERPWLTELPGLASDAGPATARDIAVARVALRLVVLASCESGRGRVRTGEGLAGLSSAFLAAGADNVVSTLWPVDDHATRRLMDEFYDALADGEDPAAALHRAQRRIARDPATRQPFYWAGFVLTGEAIGKVGLRRRPWPVRHAVPLAVGLGAGVGLLAVARERRRGRAAGATQGPV